MRVSSGNRGWEWREDWAQIPASESFRSNGRTHGAAVKSNGEVIVFAQANPAVMIFSPSGELRQAWGDRFAGAHGLTLAGDYLWLTDQHSGEVVKTTLEGETVLSIARPAVPDGQKYSPTWVAIDPVAGDVWVADGYGTNIVRRYDAGGSFVGQITGEEGPGRFQCAHGIAFDPDGRLLVTDRRNRRILIYDRDGRYVSHRDHVTHSPCCFAFHDDAIYVPELWGALKVLDRDLNLIAEIGINPAPRPEGGGPPAIAGWPNLAGTEHVRQGIFNSPHGVAVAADGTVYVVEWIVGGRVIRLKP